MFKVRGKIIEVIPELRGQGKNGEWVKGGFVIETQEQYPKKIMFTTWGEDKATAVRLIALNTEIEVTFIIASREYEKKWYTDAECKELIQLTEYTTITETPQYVAPPQDDTQEQKCLLDEQPKQAEDLPF